MVIKTLTEKRSPLIYLIPTGFVCLYFVIKTITQPVGDFGNYYYAARFLSEGNWGQWIYDPYQFNKAIFDEGQRQFFLNYTPVPPFSALFYVPFGIFSITTAKVVWNVVNVATLLWALYRLQNLFQCKPVFIALVMVLFALPIRANITEGQSYFLLLALIVEGFVAYQNKTPIWYGLLWAIAVHLKITPLFLGVFLCLKREWKGTLWLGGSIVVLGLISLPWLHVNTWTNYLSNVLPRLYLGEINNTYAVNYQSAQVLLKTLFVPDGLHNPNVWFNNPYAYEWIWQTFKWLLTGLAVVISVSAVSTPRKLAIWLVTSLLISGYGNSFSLILLVFPVLFYVTQFGKADYIRGALFMSALVFILFIPYQWFSAYPILFRFPRLFGLLLLLVVLIKKKDITKQMHLLWLSPVLAYLLASPTIPNRSSYLLTKEVHLLNNKYEIKGGKIEVSFFDFSGPGYYEFALPFKAHHIKEVSAEAVPHGKHEQIKQVTAVNDSVFIYLSDKNRGVGFYTLHVYKP